MISMTAFPMFPLSEILSLLVLEGQIILDFAFNVRPLVFIRDNPFY